MAAPGNDLMCSYQSICGISTTSGIMQREEDPIGRRRHRKKTGAVALLRARFPAVFHLPIWLDKGDYPV